MGGEGGDETRKYVFMREKGTEAGPGVVFMLQNGFKLDSNHEQIEI